MYDMKGKPCELCGMKDYEYTIDKQVGGEWVKYHVCKDCAARHESYLEKLRQNFQIQFGEK